ncbi:MAG TPA: TonB family protein [Pyrinomonadaceae bacterium]|jgi:TonB family protein
MLDQLVESKSNTQENTRKAGILAVILILMVSAVFGGILWDLSKLFRSYLSEGMGGDLELTALVAPVPVQAEEPPPPEIKEEKPTKVEQNVDVRKEIIFDVSQSTKIPDKVETQAVKVNTVRKDVTTVLGDRDSNTDRPMTNPNERIVTETKGVGDTDNSKQPTDTNDDEPKIATPTPKPTEKPVPKIVSGGVVNSKATNLVKPAYPQAARAVRASGAVNVQVTISETGSVISASAVSGHPLLRQAAEQAARSSKFSPTLLSGQPVKVTGVIVYNFVP